MKQSPLKQQWDKLAARIDAMSVRERVMIFGASCALLLFLLYSLFLNPLFVRQQRLSASLAEQQATMAGIDAEILQKISSHAIDPDAAERAELDKARQEVTRLGHTLRSTQAGLVAPERIVFLLERLLKQHARLKVESLKTLQTIPLGDDSVAAGAPATAPSLTSATTASGAVAAVHANAANAANASATPAVPAVKPPPLLYRHGVEVVLQGSYIDMVNYMEALEAMPTRVFWGKASMSVERYPHASLKLTLYTLSLDNKWIAL